MYVHNSFKALTLKNLYEIGVYFNFGEYTKGSKTLHAENSELNILYMTTIPFKMAVLT